MAIYPLNFPTKSVSSERIGLTRRQVAIESPHTYAMQVVNTASMWMAELTWPPMSLANAEILSAWLLSLKGQVGSFRYAPRQSAASTLTGRRLAVVGYAYNDAVSVTGWAAGAASTLRVGQFLQIGNQLLRITTANSFADASGRVTISFEPSLRSTLPLDEPVIFQSPEGLFRLASAETPAYTLNRDKLAEFGAIQCREVVE